jgi:Ca2+-transporting ATPase
MKTKMNVSRSQEKALAGLTQQEAADKLLKEGENKLIQARRISPVVLFLEQFKDIITMVLLAATLASLFLGETADAITIIIIIVMNSILGFVQEYRTERSLEALKELSAPQAAVLRDGKETVIAAKHIVRGDVLILESGDRIPADCVLAEGGNIRTDEAILTGESVPVEKHICFDLESPQLPKESMLYMGTNVTAGRGKAVVTGTGMNTEMGKIAHMLQSIESEDTPLKKHLNRIGKELVMICLGVCVLIILAGLYHGETIYNMFLSGISLAVAAIPEGLPAIVTVCLAIGVQRMLKKNALVRKLPAVETLGSIDVICSDKTGTLTENKMTVKKVFVNNTTLHLAGGSYTVSGDTVFSSRAPLDPKSHNGLNMLLTIGALCNNAELREDGIYGDPTEAAILMASRKGGIDKAHLSGYKRVFELPFDSDRKLMSVIYKTHQNEFLLFVKGAPDRILDLCNQQLTEEGVAMLTGVEKEHILAVNDKQAADALRVLAFAYKKLEKLPGSFIARDMERNLIFVGLEGMIDPPRPEAAAAIKSCYKAGIKPVMITGDHKVTAVAVARELGMELQGKEVITGDELEMMSDHELEAVVEEVPIYARVSPRHKLRIVQALKRKNNTVAMTGDGVNDAPALKEADIGVAMGKNGTDVAKEAAAMVLLDDNFATIVSAIEEGRMIYDNIRKFIRYLLSCNLGEILMMGAAAFIGMPLPLIPIQILWLNLVTDGLPALALGVDPPDRDIMSRPPRKNNEGIFSKGLGSHIAVSGFFIGLGSLLSFLVFMNLTAGDLAKSRTAAFATMIVAELIFSFECRSEYRNIFRSGMFKNKYLVLAVAVSVILTLLVIYTPFLSRIFMTTALSMKDWLLVLSFSVIELVINIIATEYQKGSSKG